VDIWAQAASSSCPSPTFLEMREALARSGGDVAEALLDVVHAQARRNEAAKVRSLLSSRDPHRIAGLRAVNYALDSSDGNPYAAMEMLMQDATISLLADKSRILAALHQKMPSAHPRSRDVERAIAVAQEAVRQATEELHLRKAAAAESSGQSAELRAKLAEAEGNLKGLKGKEEKEAKQSMLQLEADLAAAEEADREAEARVAAAEAMVAGAGDPGAVADVLAADAAVQEAAQQLHRSWPEMLEAAKNACQLEFRVLAPGWTSIGATASPGFAARPRSAQEPAPGLPRTSEFFPEAPQPTCTAWASSLVLGTFDLEVLAARVSAVGTRYRGADSLEEVSPDGAFSLVVQGGSHFELRTQRSDDAEVSCFGPFPAEAPGHITHLGLLPRAVGGRACGDDLASRAEVLLPALEFPPQRPMDASPAAAQSEERCTCFDGKAIG